jgi:O-antigen/teichoic acid export membrane protein
MPSWRTGLARTALGLTASGALAQALPLLLGPWLTRLFSPAQFGQFTVFATAAASIGVVACARYEFALPMVAGEADARDLMALCLRILVVVTLITTLPAVLLWAAGQGSFWLLLPAFVMSYGASQWLTLWATRAERFRGL